MKTKILVERIQLLIVWVITLFVSILPDIFIKEILRASVPAWLFWAKISLLLFFIITGWFYKPLSVLRKYLFIMFVLFMLEYGAAWLSGSVWWKSLFPGSGFISTMFGQQVLRASVALLLVVVLLIIQKKFNAFYLVKGNMSAEAAPIPLLIDRPTSWKKLGLILTLCISGGTLIFLVIGGGSLFPSFGKVLPILPAVLLLALMNSFSEEMSYRAGFLSVLYGPFGKNQSLLITSLFFGIGHFYGVPYGVLGVFMASILGWFLGKSMLETKGFAWAWVIHFVQDVLIFTFMAMGAIIAGGK
jgi:uncharacterized protein